MPKEADQKEQITHPSIDPSPGRIAGVNGNVRAASRNNFSLAVASRYNAPHEVQPAEPAVSDQPKRRWYQFRLRTFFVVLTAMCALLAWGLHEGGRRNRTINKLQNAGATLALEHKFNNGDYREHEEPPGSPLLKLLFGEFYATRVSQIELFHPETFTDAQVREIAILTELDWLAISGSRITDEGLEAIAKLPNLGRLDIETCKVSEQAVKKLRRALPNTRVFSDYD